MWYNENGLIWRSSCSCSLMQFFQIANYIFHSQYAFFMGFNRLALVPTFIFRHHVIAFHHYIGYNFANLRFIQPWKGLPILMTSSFFMSLEIQLYLWQLFSFFCVALSEIFCGHDRSLLRWADNCINLDLHAFHLLAHLETACDSCLRYLGFCLSVLLIKGWVAVE